MKANKSVNDCDLEGQFMVIVQQEITCIIPA